MRTRLEFSCRRLAAATTLILALGASYPAAAQTPRPGLSEFLRGRVTRVQPHTPVKGWISPQAAGQHLVYVAAAFQDFVNIYPAAGQSQKPIGAITNGISAPQGLAVDTAGNLYVANQGNNTVTVYPPGQIDPSITYTNGLALPIALTVGADSTLYVANVVGAPDGFGSVSVYPPGSVNPSETLTLSGWFAVGTAVDSTNNLYVLWFDFSTFSIRVYKYAPGSTNGTDLGLHMPTGGVFPGFQLTFDGTGNLVLSFEWAQTEEQFVEAFPPGSTNPSRVIDLGSLGNVAEGFAFSHDFNFLYISLTNANVWMKLTYPNNPKVPVLPIDVVNIQGTGLALSPGT